MTTAHHPAANPRAGRPPRAQDWRCWRDASHGAIGTHPELGFPVCQECHAAPAYYERPVYLPPGFRLNVYVPKAGIDAAALGSLWQIKPGSAIVGIPDSPVLYFEGFIFGGQRFDTPRARWEEAVQVAGGRLITDYPTTAKTLSTRPGSLVAVGTWTPARGRAGFDVTDEGTLDAWLEAQSSGDDRDA